MIEIENMLIGYGPLGAWTAYLIWERITSQKSMKKAIDNNTEALMKFKDVIIKCRK